MHFWQQLLVKKSPILGLSPMDGVTDAPMRYMSAKYGQPDVVFTEFVSVDALAHAKEERSVDRVMRAFIKARDVGSLGHKPYEIAQVFGHTPELFYQAAVMIATLGFDGMDINMGCPAHKVEEQGSGAGLIRIPEVAKEIVRQAKAGMADYAAGKVTIDDLAVSDMVKVWVKAHAPTEKPATILPVSLKTRLGVSEVIVEAWMAHVMEVEPAMITLHGRTLKQLYQGEADWEAIGRAAAVVHSLGGHLLGNGDIQSLQDLEGKVGQYGVDGGLIGRWAEGNPAIFLGENESSREQRLSWILEHVKIYEETFKPKELTEQDRKSWFMPMRKHLAWYCKGFPGAAELRVKLVMSNSREEVEEIVASVV
jgi:tRNA-dihydrouridine synthase B